MNVTTLAIDAATSRLTVALAHGDLLSERHIDGPRRHANEILVLVDDLLAEHQLAARQIGHVITGDGPGSFTGLRVAASVAKALTWGRPDTRWSVAPSLLIRAVAAANATAKRPITVLALSDALRGELYAGCWRFDADTVALVGPSPRAMRPEALGELGPVDAVTGTIPDALIELVGAVANITPVTGEPALPDARDLIALSKFEGGLTAVHDRSGWHPDYGRPAEAQAVWERKFGRRLPDSTYHSG